ncbi:MAG: alpha/beta fold hydrolase [Sphingorhabdus sp.]
MMNFVLVHGGYAGVDSFGDVPNLLRSEGHEVLAATLPGLGTRQGELHPAITLSDHIDAVCEQIETAGFDRFILVAHSYGGIVAAGVAGRLGPCMDAICYIDAFLPEDGQCLWDFFSDDERNWYIQNQKHKPGLVDPIGAENFQVVPDVIGYQPLLTFTEAVSLSGNEQLIPRKAYVFASGWKRTPFCGSAEKAKAAGWAYHEIDSNHFVMENQPRWTTDILLALAKPLA